MYLLTLPSQTIETIEMFHHHNYCDTRKVTIPGKMSFIPVKVLLEEPINISNQTKFDCECENIRFFGCLFTEIEYQQNLEESKIIGTMSYDYFEIKGI